MHPDQAASLPAMILPALPKRFCFETSFGEEWRPFWEGLWQRARCAIAKADELIIIGYSMPVIDQQARSILFDTRNKSASLSICCGKDSVSIEEEFRHHGFRAIRTVGHTFDDFLRAESAGGDVDKVTPRLRARTQSNGLETAKPSPTATFAEQRTLMASAKLRTNGMATYSEEGTPVQDRLVTMEMLRLQLYRKLPSERTEGFVSELHSAGYAEIWEPRLGGKFFSLG
jgi:hypothetical protein